MEVASWIMRVGKKLETAVVVEIRRALGIMFEVVVRATAKGITAVMLLPVIC